MAATELDLGFRVRPMAGHIGAALDGLDVTQVDDRTVDAIRRVWLDRLVVVITGQDELDPDGLADFASRFGPIYHHPMMEPGAAPVHALNIPAGGYWHSDVTFAEEPPAATMLHAQVVPEAGGDTMWANMYLAYETLSPKLRAFLDSLGARHDFDHFYRYPLGDSLATDEFILEQKKRIPLPVHPVVRTHPETGRKALFVNESFTTRIEDLSQAESDALLAFLFRHSVQPEFTCRHHWSAGDIAFWDNRCAMHYPVDDWGGTFENPDESPRRMTRATIDAQRPV